VNWSMVHNESFLKTGTHHMKIVDFFQTRNQDEMKDILERIELLEEEVEVLRDVNKKLRFSLEVLMQARVSPKSSKIVAEKTPVKKIA